MISNISVASQKVLPPMDQAKVIAATSGLSRKMLVHEPNRHGTLTDRRAHAFGRASADVADREDAGSAGLQHQRRTRYMTPHVLVTELIGVGAREHEPVQIEGDSVGEPRRMRSGADEDEERSSCELAALTVLVVLDHDGFEGLVTDHVPHFGARHHLDAGMTFDLVN